LLADSFCTQTNKNNPNHTKVAAWTTTSDSSALFTETRVQVQHCPGTRHAFQWRNSSRSHTYEYRLPVNFTRMSSFYAGHVFVQPVQSKLPINSIKTIYKSYGTYLMPELTSL